jgi:hypothetical protein
MSFISFRGLAIPQKVMLFYKLPIKLRVNTTPSTFPKSEMFLKPRWPKNLPFKPARRISFDLTPMGIRRNDAVKPRMIKIFYIGESSM